MTHPWIEMGWEVPPFVDLGANDGTRVATMATTCPSMASHPVHLWTYEEGHPLHLVEIVYCKGAGDRQPHPGGRA